MTELDIIYKISADITGLQDGVNRAAKATEGLETIATRMTGVLAGMFSVSAAINFGRVLLDDADALVKLSDKTGITTQGLQRLQIAGDDAGNTVEQLTSAVSQLQNRLGKGDPSALTALQRLGISFEELRLLSPEKQFVAIAEAVAKVKDPLQQAALANALFGRIGVEILPTLKRGFDDLKDSVVGMSDETVRSLDEAGDILTSLTRTTKAWAAEGLVATTRFLQDGMVPFVVQATREAKALNEELAKMGKAVPSGFALPDELQVPTSESASVNRAIKESEDQLRESLRKRADAQRETEASAKKLRDEQEKFRESVVNLTTDAVGAAQGLGMYGMLMPDLTAQTIRLADQTIVLDSAIDATAADVDALQRQGRFLSASLQTVNQSLMTLPAGASAAADAIEEVRNEAGKTTGILGGLTDSLKSLWQGFSGGQGIAGVFMNLGKGMIEQFGALLTGGITSLINTGLGLLGKGLQKLFNFGGPSGQEKAGRLQVSDFERELAGTLTAQQKAEAGGEAWKETVIAVRDQYLQVGLTAEDAERDVKALWDSSRDGGESVERAIERIRQNMDRLKATAQDAAAGISDAFNGISVDGFGSDFAQKGKYRIDPVPMATGGMGTVTSPTLFLAGEAGPEQFAFWKGGQNPGGGWNDAAIIAELRAIRAALGMMPTPVVRVDDVIAGTHRAYGNNRGGTLTELQELVGTT